jgi:hypothetical protein
VGNPVGHQLERIVLLRIPKEQTMIEGLRLTIPGEKLRLLLHERIHHHQRCADRWAREQTRTPSDQTEDNPLLPEHMCSNEEERHRWRIEVLSFIRDHIEIGETYRLAQADLDFGELLPSPPESLAQEEFEDRTRMGLSLERIAKASEGFGSLGYRLPLGEAEDTDDFSISRPDLGNGPEDPH